MIPGVRDIWRCDDCSVQWSSDPAETDPCWVCGETPVNNGRYIYGAATYSPQQGEEFNL